MKCTTKNERRVVHIEQHAGIEILSESVSAGFFVSATEGTGWMKIASEPEFTDEQFEDVLSKAKPALESLAEKARQAAAAGTATNFPE